MRLKLIISYHGAAFFGWQSQLRGGAVQDVIEKAFFRIVSQRVVVHGAGRTDAGVHALGQCAHVDVPDDKMDLSHWRRALNANLPGEVRILEARRVIPDFHARFSATGKIYRYRIWNSEVVPPLERGRVWQVPGPLDFEILRANAAIFEGRHDFTSFSANGKMAIRNSVRTVRMVRITRHPYGEIRLTFEGEGFLYKMVRMMTGALIRVGQGKEDGHWISGLLASSTVAKRNQYVAPAHGLYLVRVLYGKKTS